MLGRVGSCGIAHTLFRAVAVDLVSGLLARSGGASPMVRRVWPTPRLVRVADTRVRPSVSTLHRRLHDGIGLWRNQRGQGQ